MSSLPKLLTSQAATLTVRLAKAGFDYLATEALSPAESSRRTNMTIHATDDFTQSVDALTYYIAPDG